MGCFYFNRAWLDFRGRTLEQEQGNGWAEGVHPEDVQRCVRHYVGCFEQRMAFAMSYRLKNRAGEYRWILDRGAPNFQRDGTFLGFYGGCAETAGDMAIERIGQLRASLGEMVEFAQLQAADAPEARDEIKETKDKMSLESFAKAHHANHREQLRRKQHAAGQISRLAEDMLAYGQIGDGTCLVDGTQKPAP